MHGRRPAYQSRSLSLPDLSWSVPHLKPASTLIGTAIYLKLLAPLRDEIDKGQTGDLTGWSSLVPETEGNIWGEGCRVCDFSNCLNPPFGTQGRSRRLNEAYILQARNVWRTQN